MSSMLRHLDSSSSVFEAQRVRETREFADMSAVPGHDDTRIIHLMNGSYEFPDQRTDYRFHQRNNRPTEEVAEGGWARYRADNNFANTAKFASLSSPALRKLAGLGDGVEGVAVGGTVGAVAGGLGALGHLTGKLGKWGKYIPKSWKNGIALGGAKAGAAIGALAGGTAGIIKEGSSGGGEDPSHFYITDMGVAVLPKKIGPADLTAAFHMSHPAAKYLPLTAAAGTIGGTLLAESLMGKAHSTPSLIAAATLGGGLGTIAKLYQEDKFLDPYKKPFIKGVEHKYHTKLSSTSDALASLRKSASEPANEYITETNIEMLPFHDTSPADLDVAYRFRHPIGNYAPAVGTMLGAAGSLAFNKMKGRPISTVNTLMAGTMGGVAAALAQQVHKDRVLSSFRKPVLDQMKEKYSQG